MTDKKKEQAEKKGCSHCGDERIILTEEKGAEPRCAGCGRPIKEHK